MAAIETLADKTTADPRQTDGPFLRPAYEILRPGLWTSPLILDSPHSGRRYPPSLLARSRLTPTALRRSEDGFVDELFLGAVQGGAPLLRAHFPRAYVDANREPYELDPAMFLDPLPAHANTRSYRVSGGLGTIARVVGDGSEIYRGKLAYHEAEWRIRTLYEPYHAALRSLIEQARHLFGCALLLDCHSMPSVGGPSDSDHGRLRPDIVLGDRFGTTASRLVVDRAQAVLAERGYSVARNNPYAGGFITENYGCPARGIHVLQIEINRGLYMEETRVARAKSFGRVAADMAALAAALGELGPRALGT